MPGPGIHLPDATEGVQRIADLFEHRHLFVAHHLSQTQRRTLHSP